MGINASLFGRVKHKNWSYEEVSLTRYYWLNDSEILTFLGGLGIYFTGTVPIHDSSFNWESDFDKVLNQLGSAIDFQIRKGQRLNNSEELRLNNYKIAALKSLNNNILAYKDNWDCLIVLADSGDCLYDALVYNNVEIELNQLETLE